MPVFKHRPWAQAVTQILDAAGIDRTALAEDADLSKGHVSNCLTGARTPSPEHVSRINRAVNRLTRTLEAGMLLDNEAMLCGLFDAEKPVPSGLRDRDGVELSIVSALYSMNMDELVCASVALVDTYANALRPGYRVRMEAFMRESSEAAARRFFIELNRAFLRILIAELWPPPAGPIGFGAVCEVLKRHGLDSALVSSHGAFLVAYEQFQWTVRCEIAAAIPIAASKERLAAEKRIFDALNQRFELRLKPRAAKQRRKGGLA